MLIAIGDNTCDLKCDAAAGFHGDDKALTCGMDGGLTGTPTCTACLPQKGCATPKSNCAASVSGGTKLECETAAPGYFIQNELVRAKTCAIDEYVDGSHTCQACTGGLYNLAGDDATGPATTCDGYGSCAVNQCVVAHALYHAFPNATPMPSQRYAENPP